MYLYESVYIFEKDVDFTHSTRQCVKTPERDYFE